MKGAHLPPDAEIRYTAGTRLSVSYGPSVSRPHRGRRPGDPSGEVRQGTPPSRKWWSGKLDAGTRDPDMPDVGCQRVWVAAAALRSACRGLRIEPPRLRFYSPLTFDAGFPLRPGLECASGGYLPSDNLIFVASGRSLRQTAETTAHECAHAGYWAQYGSLAPEVDEERAGYLGVHFGAFLTRVCADDGTVYEWAKRQLSGKNYATWAPPEWATT
jgi:hypothetical protein